MLCPKCKKAIDPDSQFCKLCGAAVVTGRKKANPPAGDRPSHAGPKAAGGKPDGDAAARFKKATQAEETASRPAAASGDTTDVYSDPASEKEVWRGRPAWRSYWGLWTLWAILSITLLVLGQMRYSADVFVTRSIYLLVAGSAVALLTREALVVWSLSYRLTTQRLFITRGILTRTTDQMELMRIDDVRLRQGIVDRIVGTGTIEIMGTDETDEDAELESISNPTEVAEQLRRHMRGVRSKNTLRIENV